MQFIEKSFTKGLLAKV